MKCEIIRDLLPSYLDELTSAESNQAIEEHLQECKDVYKRQAIEMIRIIAINMPSKIRTYEYSFTFLFIILFLSLT